MSLTATWDGPLARVRLAGASLSTDPHRVERSTDGVRWTVVRGGIAITPGAGSLALDDYEFTPGVLNQYRLVDEGPTGDTATITPVIDRVWVKSLTRPFLNRTVVVQDYSDIDRPTRAGIHDVIGRTLPVVTTDVASSRRWTMTLLATTDEARTLDLIVASGDPLLVQVPADCEVPGGYVVVTGAKTTRPARRSPRRLVPWDLVEVAAPGPDILGATVTWTSVAARYATWTELLAAHATWAELLELIGDPEEVIVP
ncbi:hypothetical protein ACIA59_10655 [Micromonospora haikouensis]|uniref:hypothetical protein n=1 Tax=Micromonospora haikouensis TaxID=686309 RepID=UPI0037B3724D